MKFYRYDVGYGESGGGIVVLSVLYAHRETPKGHWVSHYPSLPCADEKRLRKMGYVRWVANTGRKRYCYPTKEEALTSLIARTERRIVILRERLDAAREALEVAKGMEAGAKTGVDTSTQV